MALSTFRATVSMAAVGAALLLAACESSATGSRDASPDQATVAPVATATAEQGPPRSFALGFSDFPHARSVEALVDAYDVIERDGDLVVEHCDGGVPWPEARANAAFAEDFRREVAGKASVVPDSHLVYLVYLAVTPISFERDALASYRGATANEPLPASWSERAFDDPEVVAAYIAYVEWMVAAFEPDYLAYAIEANMLAEKAPQHWTAFLTLAEATYGALKEAHPTLPS